MAATIKDISKRTGLSLGTVSNYLNGYKVKEKNQKLIEDAIEELDYKVNNLARGLRTNRSYLVAIVVPDLGLDFCIDMISAVSNTISKNGYNLVLCVLNGSEYDKVKFENLASQNIDGYIIMPPDETCHIKDSIDEISSMAPVIMVDREMESENDLISVTVNNEKAAFDAVNKLIDMGHEKIAIINSYNTISTANMRLKGYKKALKSRGISVNKDYIFEGKFSESNGYDSCKEALELEDPPTAFFTTSLSITKGVVKYLQSSEKYRYADFEVLGFDTESISDILSPKLNVVNQPVEDMGKFVGEKLIKLINEEEEYEPNNYIFDCELNFHDR